MAVPVHTIPKDHARTLPLSNASATDLDPGISAMESIFGESETSSFNLFSPSLLPTVEPKKMKSKTTEMITASVIAKFQLVKTVLEIEMASSKGVDQFAPFG